MKQDTTGATTATPRSTRAAHAALAARGSLGFARLLAFVALIEIGITAASAFAGADAMPIVLRDLGNFMRAIYCGVALVMALRFVPLAKSSRAHAFALAACSCFGLATIVGALPFFDVVPSMMEDLLWDALLQVLRAIAFIAGTCLLVWTARAVALAAGQRGIAQLATWCMLPLVTCLPVAFQAIDPVLVPTTWVAPALAVSLPFGMALGGLMRWDLAAWWALGVVALGGILLLGGDPGAATFALVGLVGVLTMAALSIGETLRRLVAVVDEAPAGAVSRTLIERMMTGSLGNEGSRIGDLNRSASRAGSDPTDDAESLARAYRELGINAEPPYEPTDAAPLDSVSPLIPKGISDKPPATHLDTEEADDGRLAAVIVLPAEWTATYGGLRRCFAAFIARVGVVVFGLLLSSSPLANMLPATMLFDLALIASALPFMRGLHALRKAPLDTLRSPANVAFALATLVVALDVALLGMRLANASAPHAAQLDRGPWLAANALAGVFAVAAYLISLRRLSTHLRQPKLRSRSRGTLVLLIVWSAFAAGTVITKQLPASDLQWLAFPLGFATAGVGLGLWIALLWLTRDTQEALRP